MSGIYLTNAADWFRAAGLRVVEQDGWKRRAKSSGGYASGRPYGVMWHHTAGSGSTSGEANYMSYGASAAPIANVCIGRDGEVWVLAAGPTNTNGSGNAYRFSKGVVPDSAMNSFAWGMEINNNGRGQAYPQAQIDAAFVVSNTINAHMGNQFTDVCTHTQWAPSRKTDPATAAAVQGPWKPRSINNSGSWNLDDLKAECARRAGQPSTSPAPQPPPEDDVLALIMCADADAAFVGAIQKDPVLVGLVEWTGPGSAWRAPALVNGLKARVTVNAADLTNITLVGDIPQGDRKKQWGPGDFYAVIPRG